MKPLRFLLCVVSAYVIGFMAVRFLSFGARLLREPALAYGSIAAVVLITFLFAVLYFRAVPDLSWRHRLEAIGVWLALIVLTDTVALFAFYKVGLPGFSSVHVLGYSLVALLLFIASFLSAPERFRFTKTPNFLEALNDEERTL